MDTDHYRQTLLEMKQDISNRLSAIEKDMLHEGMSADWSDQASERENDEVLESLGNVSEQELEMINLALQRIENGNYLQCIECGEDITPARLDLLPFTCYCVDCAENIE